MYILKDISNSLSMKQQRALKLQAATREKLRRFDSLRGREVQDDVFWDVVVLTAADHSQREAYDLQVRGKVDRRELPLGVHYRVYSDPPGPKIGNGGSTLYALQQLDEEYGKALGRMRIILIHAGGFSQRLPSASALGKIFTAVPLGDPLYQMLELKLAMYVDFPSHMKPGVLVTCADDIELYSNAENENITFDKPGFTALAHPSSLSIGTTHGVFVVDSCEKSPDVEMENSLCLRFLHKPNIEKMQDCGAVCKWQRGGSSPSDTEFVYTDSTYYIDFQTVKTLQHLLKEVGTVNCEIDAYGDFLQALGPKATVEYTSNTANVSKEEKCLVDVRKKIFHLLKGTPLNVVLLNNSKFYHIGTTSEYLFHLTEDMVLRRELGLLSSAFSVDMDENPGSCVMYSCLDPSCTVGAGSVVEYCRLGAGASVGKGSVVSSCWLSPGLSVPDAVFMHSLSVTHKNQTRFVTVAFGINDNLKNAESPANMLRLKFSDVSLAECLPLWGMERELLTFYGDVASCSLWNASLFPVGSDLRNSFSLTLKMLQAVLSGSAFTLPKGTELMSMQECLRSKNLEEMLTFRVGLYSDIIRERRPSS